MGGAKSWRVTSQGSAQLTASWGRPLPGPSCRTRNGRFFLPDRPWVSSLHLPAPLRVSMSPMMKRGS